MNDSKALTCPNCGHDLACSYYAGGRVVGCETCGLRGPKSNSVDDPVAVPLALFTRHCTHSVELDVLRAINAELESDVNALDNERTIREMYVANVEVQLAARDAEIEQGKKVGNE